jgi:hypothetical protein
MNEHFRTKKKNPADIIRRVFIVNLLLKFWLRSQPAALLRLQLRQS